MTEWWQQTIENTKQKHSSIYMGNSIIQEMNSPATFYTCMHFVYHCTIILKWQLCSFLVCNTNSQPHHTNTMKQTIKIKQKTNKRLASTQTQINSSTVLVWTCNKLWHKEACDWTGWTETPILSVNLTDSTCVYRKGWRGGGGLVVLNDTQKYTTWSPHIRPFVDLWHDVYTRFRDH